MRPGARTGRLIPLLLLAVCAGSLFAAFLQPSAASASVLEVTFETGAEVNGYIIREELPLCSASAVTVPLLSEGEKAAAGQAVAIGCDEAVSLPAPASAKRALLSLRYGLSASMPSLSSDLRTQLAALAADPGDPAVQLRVEGLLLRAGTDVSVLRREAERLETALAALPAGHLLRTERPGWFSACADGYETVLTPESAASIQEAEPVPEPLSPQVYGKLILSPRWYFAAILPPDTAAQTGSVTLTLPDGDAFSMRVERCEAAADGRLFLLLSCGSGLRRVTALRRVRCRLTFSARTALQLPAAALRTDEAGETGVYVREGASARWKPVTILETDGSGCYVTSDALRAGSEVLLEDYLYDGKVVYP